MMSALEIRNDIINDCLPKLITLLTGFQPEEENFQRCEQFAFYTIKKHRYLSVNSHALRRQIDGMKEKFAVGNCEPYAEHLEKLCNRLVSHPICLEHYETDIAWSVLEFLFSLAYNPVGALRRNKDKIDLTADLVEEEEDKGVAEARDWLEILKEEFVPVEHIRYSDESDLSDWSDSSDAKPTARSSPITTETTKNEHEIEEEVTTSKWCLKPPRKEEPFSKFVSDQSSEWLMSRAQNSWWQNFSSHCHVESAYMETNFARLWQEFLSDSCWKPVPNVSTEQEYALVREVIWMFHGAGDCKFFQTSQSGDLEVRRNVSIPSVTSQGLRQFLQDSILPYVQKYVELTKFISSVYIQGAKSPPKTYECYAASLKEILTPFAEKLIDLETRFRLQNPLEINTIIQFHSEMREQFLCLDQVYDLHKAVTLDFQQYPGHILSAYLLAGLLHAYQTAASMTISNLSAALFLSSVKIFCLITDRWWSEGRLVDWKNEFLVERADDLTDNINIRPFAKDKQTSLFVPAHVSKLIADNEFFNLLKQYSLEAGDTLNLLYQIQKIGDMRDACHFQGELYKTLLDDVVTTLANFHEDKPVLADKPQLDCQTSPEVRAFATDCLAASDELLLMSFLCNMDLSTESAEAGPREWTAQSLFEKFNELSHIALPLERIILESMSKLLKSRISFANNFVVQMYREEFEIEKHLQNIRKVLLLESSDLMHCFYVKLFEQIESRSSWANALFLNAQLDDIIGSKFPQISSLYRLEIGSAVRCQSSKVLEVVEEITISYILSEELSFIITESAMKDYNKVFQFLLKVKWGLWTLENMHFPASHKRRPPYADYRVIDLIMRRLEQLRFWMIYALQCIHFHLMTHVLKSIGQQLDEKIARSTNLSEMKSVHTSFMKTICEHSFLADAVKDVKFGVEQLLNLVYVLRLEWNGTVRSIDSSGMFSSSDSFEDAPSNYVSLSTVESIEVTYIRCHQYLAKTLNNEVFVKKNAFLTGLSAAFNTSLPY